MGYRGNYSLESVVYYGPYFNNLKSKYEMRNASSFVGGSLPLLLLYRRINDSCAQRKSKISFHEVV